MTQIALDHSEERARRATRHPERALRTARVAFPCFRQRALRRPGRLLARRRHLERRSPILVRVCGFSAPPPERRGQLELRRLFILVRVFRFLVRTVESIE